MFVATNEYSLNADELDFLRAHLKPSDVAWEWGSGVSTIVLSNLCRRVTSVEHSAVFAARSILNLHPFASVLHVPPERGDWNSTEDGDYDAFRSYVDAYSGKDVDVVLIDGRARVACARRVAETAPFGPHPGLRVFLHDWERIEYAAIFAEPDGYFRRVAAEGRLMLIESKL